MAFNKKTQVKTRLHPSNRNRDRYDLGALREAVPELQKHTLINPSGQETVDFSDSVAVKLLNKALLKHYYGIDYWEFPDHNLCPPIPGRADYIHHVADLLSESNFGIIPKGEKVTCLDVGVGASCIYPILGVTEYQWNFIGSDIDPKSIASATEIVKANKGLRNTIELRLQKNSKHIFKNVLSQNDKIELVICNPPFHSSYEEAREGTLRKIKNLSGKKVKRPELNFSGLSNELIYDGGELQFIHNMIRESANYSKTCFWFSTLVSKQSHLVGIKKSLEHTEATEVKTIAMGTGNKSTRIIAWTYLSKEKRKDWALKWGRK